MSFNQRPDGIRVGLDGPVENVEEPWSYQPGGHHPVHLGDYLGHDIQYYRVLHKLNTSGSGNLWLCRLVDSEPTEYVAVKILTAEFTAKEEQEGRPTSVRLQRLIQSDLVIRDYCPLPQDTFLIDGPNGQHRCYVYRVPGPSVGRIEKEVADPHGFLRRLLHQTVELMAAFHRHGVCHGGILSFETLEPLQVDFGADFRPANIFLQINLDGLTEKEVMGYLKEPRTAKILLPDDYDPGDSVPAYLVYPPKWHSIATRFTTDKICLLELEASFDKTSPPAQGVRAVRNYSAPELVLDGQCATASDIWSLAATLFEIRLGTRLFKLNDSSQAAYLQSLVQTLGPYPDPYWCLWKPMWEWSRPLSGPLRESSLYAKALRLKKMLSLNVSHGLTTPGVKDWNEKVPERERYLLEDLLSTMLEYKPDIRPSAERVLQHPYFTLEVTKEHISIVIRTE
ncbi:kinase-like domain-containing protein [Aspergillus egyptiacus]|nr:kinase-like domain-containing protein [Aspergillus egyptiacus]